MVFCKISLPALPANNRDNRCLLNFHTLFLSGPGPTYTQASWEISTDFHGLWTSPFQEKKKLICTRDGQLT